MIKELKPRLHDYNPNLENFNMEFIGALNRTHGVHILFNSLRLKYGYLRLPHECVHQLQQLTTTTISNKHAFSIENNLSGFSLN